MWFSHLLVHPHQQDGCSLSSTHQMRYWRVRRLQERTCAASRLAGWVEGKHDLLHQKQRSRTTLRVHPQIR
jgi:hypothetical protein